MHRMPFTWNLEAGEPSAAQLDTIVTTLAGGGVLLLPTDTIYGLHALANDAVAVQRIVAMKGREEDKPLVVLASDLAQLRTLGVELSPNASAVLESLWPAPLTAILPLTRPLPAARGAANVATRIPAVSWLRALLARTGPLASTSANRSGEPPLVNPRRIDPALHDKIDGIVAGPLLAGAASTIVDFRGATPTVVRQGEYFFTQNLWKTLWISL
jgi:L-threonylcarbamoyladenylate synthase